MSYEQTELVKRVEKYVKRELANHDGSHDFWHIHRVRNTALSIAKEEFEGITTNADFELIEITTLLHDVRDYKYAKEGTTGNDLEKQLDEVLNEVLVEYDRIDLVKKIISQMGFKEELSNNSESKIGGAVVDEDDVRNDLIFKIVQDADRLDAIGAIGIARTFCFGGAKGNPMYVPGIEPNVGLTKEEYVNNHGNVNPTINHFHEKLLKLKDLMKTESGKKRACGRHEVMVRFLNDFSNEWEGVN
jgi:uncharacterized protein